MNKKDMELVAKKLVEYVEKNPNCTRGEACRSIDLRYKTTDAWEQVKHLFDYVKGKRYPTYTRNKIAYGRELKHRPMDKQPQPSLATIDLSRRINVLINENYGIMGTDIRAILGINMTTFKRASILLDVDRKRTFGYKMAYYPKGTAPKEVKIEQPEKIIVEAPKLIAMPTLTVWRGKTPWMENRA